MSDQEIPPRSMNSQSLATKSDLVALETRSEKQDVKENTVPKEKFGIFVRPTDSKKSKFLLGACTVHEVPVTVACAATCTALQITVETNKDDDEEQEETAPRKTDEKYPVQFETIAQIEQADTNPSMKYEGPLDMTEIQYKQNYIPLISLGIPFNRGHKLTHMRHVSDPMMVPVLTVERVQRTGDCSLRKGDTPSAEPDSTMRGDAPDKPTSGPGRAMRGHVPGMPPAESNSAMRENAPGTSPAGCLNEDTPGTSSEEFSSALRGYASDMPPKGSGNALRANSQTTTISISREAGGKHLGGPSSAMTGDAQGKSPAGSLKEDTLGKSPKESSNAMRGYAPDMPPAGSVNALRADALTTTISIRGDAPGTPPPGLGSADHIDSTQGDQYDTIKEQPSMTEDQSDVTDFRTGSTEDIAVADWSSSSDGNDFAVLWSSINKDESYTPNSGELRFIEFKGCVKNLIFCVSLITFYFFYIFA